jgi:hypothetical protein
MEGYNDQEQVPGGVSDDAASEPDTGNLDSSSSSTDPLPIAKRRRATVLGSEQYYADMENKFILQGPTTIASAAHMPRHLSHAIWFGESGAVRRQRCLALVEKGMVGHHDYSGRQGWEIAFKITEVETKDNGLIDDWFVIWRTSEKSRTMRQGIEQGKLHPEHSFKSVQDLHLGPVEEAKLKELTDECKLSEQQYQSVHANEPPRVIAVGVRALKQKCNEKWNHYLHQSAENIYYGRRASKRCTLHPGSFCPIRWEDSRPRNERSLTIVTASPHCLPWTRSGSRQGLSHEEIKTYDTAMCEWEGGFYDLAFIEESYDMPAAHFSERMRAVGHVLHVKVGDERLGLPVSRPRFYGACLSGDSLIWLGPREEDCTEHFLSFFERTCQFSAADFVGLDSDANRFAALNAMSKRWGLEYAPEVPLKDILSSSASRHLLACKQLMASGKKIGALPGVAADVSQSPQHRHRAGPFLPSLQISSQIVSLDPHGGDADKLYTANELAFLHGFPSLEFCPAKYKNCLNYQLSSKSPGHQARALGNGQSIVVTVAWILYVFSHTIRRDVVEGFMPPTLAPIQYDNAQQPPDSDAEEDCRQLNVPCGTSPTSVDFELAH